MQFKKMWLNVHVFHDLLQVLLHKASSSGYPLFFGLGETSRGMCACFPLTRKHLMPGTVVGPQGMTVKHGVNPHRNQGR